MYYCVAITKKWDRLLKDSYWNKFNQKNAEEVCRNFSFRHSKVSICLWHNRTLLKLYLILVGLIGNSNPQENSFRTFIFGSCSCIWIALLQAQLCWQCKWYL